MLVFKVICKDSKKQTYAYGSYLREVKRERNPSLTQCRAPSHAIVWNSIIRWGYRRATAQINKTFVRSRKIQAFLWLRKSFRS